MVICLERGADLHNAYGPADATATAVSCFSKIQIGLPFWYWLTRGNPGKRAVKRVCVCALICCVKQNGNTLFSCIISRKSYHKILR